MKHTQYKRFPFFTIPTPKFLQADLKRMDDFVVMVRLTPKITVFHYIERILYLAAFLIYSCLILLQLLSLALTIPLPTFIRFVLRNGQVILAGALGTPVPPAQQKGVLYFWILILLLAGAAWILSQTRRAFRDYRGLRQLHQMAPQQRSAFALQNFLHISLPIWLSPAITYEPTPEELLTVLGQREQALASQIQAIALALARKSDTDEEQEEHPSIRLYLILTDRLLLSILGPGGKELSMELTDAVVSLMGFLATRPPGEWIARSEFFSNHLYSREQDGLFTRHRERINAQIIDRARKGGFFPPQVTEENLENVTLNGSGDASLLDNPAAENLADDTATPPETDPEKDLDLFELKKEGQATFWRLTPRLNREVFPFLSTLYQKVLRAQALPEDPTILSLEELRQGYHPLIKEYGMKENGMGFLAHHIKEGASLWPWAVPLYRQYREQCMNVLSYEILLEGEFLKTLEDTQEQHDVISTIAQLYGWRALVGTGLDLKGKNSFSEKDIEECLFYYGRVGKSLDAQIVYQDYCALRTRIDTFYEPGEKLQKIADEVLPPPSNGSRSRKTGRDGF